MIGKIYALVCPLTNKIRYIGQTVNSLEKRLQSHFNDKNNKTIRFY
jgi:predicted GIY-YIG superfamily endonuclease